MWNKPDRRVVLKGLVGLAGMGAGFLRAADAPAPAAHGMRAVLLGTQGGPNFNPTRGETANVIVIDGRLTLVDCGYGALGALVRANLNYRNVNQVFLTHLHDDHTADLVSLMGHQWTGGRIAPTLVL